MAIDFTHPQISDNYSTGYTAGIVANQIAQAQWLDSVQTTITAGAAQYMKRYNRTSLLFEEYNGSAWATLATNYAVLTSSNNFSAQQSITTSGATITLNLIDTGGNGANFKLTSAAGAKYLRVNSVSNSLEFLNSAYSAVVASLTDLGAFSAASGSFSGAVSSGSFSTSGAISGGSLTVGGNATIGASSGAILYLNSAGTSYIQTNYAAWGMYFKPAVAGTSGSHCFANNSGSTVFSLDNTGNATFVGGVTSYGLTSNGATNINGVMQQTTGFAGSPSGLDSQAFFTIYNSNYVSGLSFGSTDLRVFSIAINSDNHVTLRAPAQLDIASNLLNVLGGVTASGAITGATITQTSDETKKHNWETPDTRETVRALSKMKTWGNFDFIESGIKSLGVGAQSIRKIPAFKNAIHGDKKTGLTMNYGGAAMVASIALSKELEALRARVAALEAA